MKLHLIILSLIFFISFQSKIVGQQEIIENRPFEIFNEYKKIGFYLSGRNYFKGEVSRNSGSIDFVEGNAFTGLSLGIEYLIRSEHKWSYRTGIHYNRLAYSKGEFFIPENFLPWLGGDVVIDIEDRLSLFSITLEAEYKHKLNNKIFLSLRTGVNILLPFQKSEFYDFDVFVESNDPEFDLVQITSYNTTQSQMIYPNLKLSPGLYFVFDTFILQTSLVYQKNILTFHKADYKFGNFDVPETTEGTYKFSGDYIGLDFVLFLKKTRTKK
jgi:hypothetical protein